MWGRIENVNASSPMPLELGIDEEGINIARLGNEYLLMARTGDHYSAARVRNGFVRQIETSGV